MEIETAKKTILSTLLILLLANFSYAQSDVNSGPGGVNVVSESAGSRIAPGEFLPVSVKLVNFGSEKRTDALVDYKIFSNADKEIHLQKEIYSQSETVAVETTASFVKRIQLPYDLSPGLYLLVTVIHYPYQKEPAISKTPFLVENKIGGVFKSDLMLYSVFLLLVLAVVILIAVLVTYTLGRYKRGRAPVFFDYNNKPKDQVIYYEILSNVITQMRLKIGDEALKVAKAIPDLDIDEKTGMIINIKQDPSKIVASLIARFEELTGQRLSFGVGKSR